MNDIRRTILWVIFGFSMVLLWDQWQIHNGKQATFFPTPGKPVATAAAPAGVASSGVPAAVGTVPLASAVPAGPAVAPAAAPAPAAARERIVVTSDVLKLTFDTEGGTLVKTEFLKHVDLADKTRNVVLLDDSKQGVYVAQSA